MNFKLTIAGRQVNISIQHIIDAVTLIVLAVAFAICMVYGFVKTGASGSPPLSPAMLAAVSLAGPALLIAAGPLSSFMGRKRFSLLTKTFTWIFAAQAAAFIGMLVIILSILLDVFESGVSTPVLPVLYMIFALTFVVGYAESVFVSEPLIALKQAEADAALLDEEPDADEDADAEEDTAEEDVTKGEDTEEAESE